MPDQNSVKPRIPGLQVMVLAGGGGTRLWPLSRAECPKPLLSLGGHKPLLELALRRAVRLAGPGKVQVVTGNRLKHQVAHLGEICIGNLREKPGALVVEPAPRNTAPAIALGLAHLLEAGASPETVVLVLPSDHLMADEEAFDQAAARAAAAASRGGIAVFGAKALGPETGYGYLRVGPALDDETPSVRPVRAFVEKPSPLNAAAMIAAGGYLWNAGMFAFRIDTMMEALRHLAPMIGEPAAMGRTELEWAFVDLPDVSIDYAVMEKAPLVEAVELDAGWTDAGTWNAVAEALPADSGGNVLQGDVLASGCRNSLILGSGRLVAGVDLDGMVVVDTPDAVLVAPRNSSQKVREVAERLRAARRREVDEAPQSDRPWGSYVTLFQDERTKIKRIRVLPGKRLSLQLHHHRSEHWVVVHGTATVTLGETARMVYEGESCFVPKGTAHRLANQGILPLEIVEVQCGEYVGEDDIVRLDDDWKRES